MKTRNPILIVALTICVLTLAGYSLHAINRIHSLEQRLNTTNQRLDQVEATLKPHFELLGSNVSPK
jgi:hypothetical protein